MRRSAGLLALLHALIGTAAAGAGQALAREPDGRALGLEVRWLARSPFPDYRIPGLFLAIVIGGTNLFAALTLVRSHPRAPAVSVGTGVLLLAWLAIQTAIIGIRHWSQGIWWVLFPGLTLLAIRYARRARHAGEVP